MFYHTTNDKEKPTGPFSLKQLRALADEGKINGSTPVIAEGANDWERFSDLICADAFVSSALIIGQGAIVVARTGAMKESPWSIVIGNAARESKRREII